LRQFLAEDMQDIKCLRMILVRLKQNLRKKSERKIEKQQPSARPTTRGEAPTKRPAFVSDGLNFFGKRGKRSRAENDLTGKRQIEEPAILTVFQKGRYSTLDSHSNVRRQVDNFFNPRAQTSLNTSTYQDAPSS